MSDVIEQSIDNTSNEIDFETISTSSVEEILNDNTETDQHVQPVLQHNTQNTENNSANNNHNENNPTTVHVENTQTNNQPVLLKIDQINVDINFPWKIHATVNCKHPKRTYENANGVGEISTWDLIDDTGAINLVAFNLNSNIMAHKLKEGQTYEFSELSIRTVDEMYKNLPHTCQITVTNKTNVHELVSNNHYQLKFEFTHLNQIETLELNSLIDIQVQVLRDYGITTGYSNNKSWSRRELHVGQDGIQIRLTLWNDQAKTCTTSMVNKLIRLKNVKISSFRGSKLIASLPNTHLIVL